MKRKVSLLLTLMLVLCFGVSAVAEEYAEHVEFTICAAHTNSTMDYTSDAMYEYFAEMFNYDFEVYPVAKDAQDEKVSIWINGGTMPDVVTWRDFDYSEYVTYAEQGLIAALPDGWEEKYPNLYWMVTVTGIYENMKIDGVTYGIPHATLARFSSMDIIVNHLSVYYRKDWAEELGIEIGDTITLSQLEEYIQACIDNDMAGNGNTLGMSCDPDYLTSFWTLFADVDYDGFYKGEDSYEWGFADESVEAALELANSWYEKGLIDPDFYLLESADALNNFTSGLSACTFYNCAISSYMTNQSTFESSTGLDASECIGITTIADDDGTVRAIQTDNYWSVTMFSPDIDEETLDRILAMMDYVCTEEGQLTVLLGIPGENWQYDEDGNIEILTEKLEDGSYPATVDLFNSYNVYRTMGILADDYSFINPANDEQVVEEVLQMYAVKQTGNIIMLDYDYEFFSSDNKANYSLDLVDEVTRIILGDADEVATEWANYIEENESIWQPVIDDLNAEFFAD